MPNIHVRIHMPYTDVSGQLVQWCDMAQTSFIFEHPADEEVNRLHIHAFLFDFPIKRKTLSGYISKTFNLKGNTDFFTSENCSRTDPRPIDLSGSYCYGSKWDSIAPLFAKFNSPDTMDKLRIYARSKGTPINIASKSNPTTIILKEIKVKSKPTQYQHLQNVLQRCMTEELDIMRQPIEIMRRRIFEVTFNYFKENEMFMGKFKQLDFLDMVMLKLDCADYKKNLWDEFQKRHGRNNFSQ